MDALLATLGQTQSAGGYGGQPQTQAGGYGGGQRQGGPYSRPPQSGGYSGVPQAGYGAQMPGNYGGGPMRASGYGGYAPGSVMGGPGLGAGQHAGYPRGTGYMPPGGAGQHGVGGGTGRGYTAGPPMGGQAMGGQAMGGQAMGSPAMGGGMGSLRHSQDGRQGRPMSAMMPTGDHAAFMRMENVMGAGGTGSVYHTSSAGRARPMSVMTPAAAPHMSQTSLPQQQVPRTMQQPGAPAPAESSGRQHAGSSAADRPRASTRAQDMAVFDEIDAILQGEPVADVAAEAAEKERVDREKAAEEKAARDKAARDKAVREEVAQEEARKVKAEADAAVALEKKPAAGAGSPGGKSRSAVFDSLERMLDEGLSNSPRGEYNMREHIDEGNVKESLDALRPLTTVDEEPPEWYQKVLKHSGKKVTFSKEDMGNMQRILREIVDLKALVRNMIDTQDRDPNHEEEIYRAKLAEFDQQGKEKLLRELAYLKRQERRWNLINGKLTLDLQQMTHRASQLQLEKSSLVEKVAELHLGEMSSPDRPMKKSVERQSQKKRAMGILRARHPVVPTDQPTEPVLVRKNKVSMDQVQQQLESKLVVDFELTRKAKQQKPDPTKPIFTKGFTHHLTLPTGMKLNTRDADAGEMTPLLEVSGPAEDIDGEAKTVVVPGLLAARAITTYPFFSFNQQREGTPICDFYHVESAPDATIVVLTDGCNWGLKSWLASRNANLCFSGYLRKHLHEMTSVQEAGLVLLKALQAAHQNVISNAHDVWSVGQTTILGGVILPKSVGLPSNSRAALNEGEADNIFVSLSLGDCKCFHYSSLSREFEDLSLMFRSDSLDAMDPGGRIGPYQPDGLPDLRNLSLSYTVCNRNDILVLCSDGVHDNLDAQYMGMSPDSCGLSDWSGRDGDCDEEVLQKAKSDFIHRWLRDNLVPPNAQPTPQHIVESLVKHAEVTTASSRKAMEENSDRRLPKDFSKFPGKMDHTACVALFARYAEESKSYPPPPFPINEATSAAASRWKRDFFPDQ